MPSLTLTRYNIDAEWRRLVDHEGRVFTAVVCTASYSLDGSGTEASIVFLIMDEEPGDPLAIASERTPKTVTLSWEAV